jgi:transketolase
MTQRTETRMAYGEALLALGQTDPRIVVLDADLYNSTRTAAFRQAFPKRFFDMGIAEADMVSTAAGMAASGLIPFCNSFAIFLTARCYDQIRIQIAYPSLPVILAGSSAGLTQGPDGASHQSLEDVALMRALPNMRVIAPADAVETRAVVQALPALGGPVYLRLGRYPVPDLHPPDYAFELGQATKLHSGDDVALLAYGHMVAEAVEAAASLGRQGVQARVLNMASLKPLDGEAVMAAADACRLLVTIEEHSIIGGLGSAVAEILAEMGGAPRLLRIGTRDQFGESGSADELLLKYGLTATAVSLQVCQALG